MLPTPDRPRRDLKAAPDRPRHRRPRSGRPGGDPGRKGRGHNDARPGSRHNRGTTCEMSDLPSIVLVTGTDTDVGKTITTAALAATLSARDRTVAVYKPTQAGTTDGQGDIDVVRRLTGLDDVHEGIRLPDPMAPVAAAARAGVRLPTARDHAAAVAQLAATHDHTLVEGAGGL